MSSRLLMLMVLDRMSNVRLSGLHPLHCHWLFVSLFFFNWSVLIFFFIFNVWVKSADVPYRMSALVSLFHGWAICLRWNGSFSLSVSWVSGRVPLLLWSHQAGDGESFLLLRPGGVDKSVASVSCSVWSGVPLASQMSVNCLKQQDFDILASVKPWPCVCSAGETSLAVFSPSYLFVSEGRLLTLHYSSLRGQSSAIALKVPWCWVKRKATHNPRLNSPVVRDDTFMVQLLNKRKPHGSISGRIEIKLTAFTEHRRKNKTTKMDQGEGGWVGQCTPFFLEKKS